MKKIILALTGFIVFLAFSCGGGNSSSNDNSKANVPTPSDETEKTTNENPSYDPHRGEGKFTHVNVGATLNKAVAEQGNKVYSVKCSSCHKLTDEKLVGPGWKEVTSRHTAEWIMNFITNTDEMLDKDPKAQAQLEICLVRMPNQNLTDEEARAVYEFQRKNDGVK